MSADGTQNCVQFVAGGPWIPVELLHAIEEGSLVLFCGAGVSCRCGLPDFKGLVRKLPEVLGRRPEPDEEKFAVEEDYPAALGLLENRIGKKRVRSAIASILDIPASGDVTTHEALLQLTMGRNGQPRLVTTNFDRAFELCASPVKRQFAYAPYLPVPRDTWRSIVHVHGGCGDANDPEHDNLIFTSADFGRAYLTEGWAARFLSELFLRTRAILFVGYRISDPVIRYIVEAFAAETASRALQDGPSRPARAYVLVGCERSTLSATERTWKARGLDPILYDSRDNHAPLHETLRTCAARFRTGGFDRRSILRDHATKEPVEGFDSVAISQVVWALSDDRGATARDFAQLEPTPPIGWLRHLDSAGLLHGVLSPGVSLSPISSRLCDWLAKHLDAPDLREWIIDKGACLHPGLAASISRELRTATLPEGLARLWRFLALPEAPIFSSARLPKKPLYWDHPTLVEIRQCLEPRIQVRRPLPWPTVDESRVDSYARIGLLPAGGEAVREFANDVSALAPEVPASLLDDLTCSLARGLEHLDYLGHVRHECDGSCIIRPFIDDNANNWQGDDWRVYVELLRNVWTATSASNPDRARAAVVRWMSLPYPIFRRFVLWTSTAPSAALPLDEVIDYLVSQPARLLWACDTRNELLRLLEYAAPRLSSERVATLEAALLSGRDGKGGEISELDEKILWSRLATLSVNGARLSGAGSARLAEIRAKWNLPENPATAEQSAREAMVRRIDDSWDGGSAFLAKSDDQVIAALADKFDDDTRGCWRRLLLEQSARSIRILEALSSREHLEPGVWEEALHFHLDGQHRPDFVRLLAPNMNRLGPDFKTDNIRPLASLVRRAAEDPTTELPGDVSGLWDAILPGALDASAPSDVAGNALESALYSPIGELTLALLAALRKQKNDTYESISEEFRARLELLLADKSQGHRTARVILAQVVDWLYRVLPAPLGSEFLDRFDWDNQSSEACGLWQGFLRAQRMTPELWDRMRPAFLKVFRHSASLGHSAEDAFYGYFASILLNPDIPLTDAEARQALKEGTRRGRARVLWYWWKSLMDRGDRAADLYRERLCHLLQNVWPLELDLHDDQCSSYMARIAVASGSEFPDAVEIVLQYIVPVDEPHMALCDIEQHGHLERHPRASLRLLNGVSKNPVPFNSARYVQSWLAQIAQADSTMVGEPDYQRMQGKVSKLLG